MGPTLSRKLKPHLICQTQHTTVQSTDTDGVASTASNLQCILVRKKPRSVVVHGKTASSGPMKTKALPMSYRFHFIGSHTLFQKATKKGWGTHETSFQMWNPHVSLLLPWCYLKDVWYFRMIKSMDCAKSMKQGLQEGHDPKRTSLIKATLKENIGCSLSVCMW